MTLQSQGDGQAPHIEVDIAVLGGGFAGVYCGKQLCRKLGDPKRAALISSQNYMVFQPMLAEVAGASLAPRHIVNPVRMLCRGMQIYKGEVTGIDLEARCLEVKTGSFSAGLTVEYKHLVMAMGAEIDLSRVPGMPEHALLMQNIGDAMILRATIISRVEEANAEARAEVRKRLLTFVVVGGGFSGVETAGEILDMLHDMIRYYPGVSPEELRVVLVHSRDVILPTLSSSLGEYAARKLKERGLELCLNERVKAVTATKVYLASGKVIETNTVLSTVGNAPHRIVREMCDKFGVEHDGYRLKTDQTLRVLGQENLWAAGDCAAVPMPGKAGEYAPQTAQFALRQGMLLANNLVSAMRGKALKPFTFQGQGELASIGHQTAVANVFGMKFSGFIAWFMWRTIYLMKLPGIERKVRVMIDWTLDLFFSRDINLLNPRYSKVHGEMHLEPGDVLFTRGEPAFSLYVVKTGRVELLDPEGKVARVIEPGDFFGERALVFGGGYLYDAVAPVSTQLISVSGEVVLPFLRTSRRLNRVLAKTTAQASPVEELKSIEEKMNPAILHRPVAEFMRTDIAVLRPDMTVQDALAAFHARRFSIYPLVNEDGTLAGALSREDFFDFLKRDDVQDDTRLEDSCRIHLPAVPATATVEEALKKMVWAGRYKSLIVDDSRKLLGILTVMDLLGAGIQDAKTASKLKTPLPGPAARM